MNVKLMIEAIIWGGVDKIPPIIRRRLGDYDGEQDDIDPPIAYFTNEKVIHNPPFDATK